MVGVGERNFVLLQMINMTSGVRRAILEIQSKVTFKKDTKKQKKSKPMGHDLAIWLWQRMLEAG